MMPTIQTASDVPIKTHATRLVPTHSRAAPHHFRTVEPNRRRNQPLMPISCGTRARETLEIELQPVACSEGGQHVGVGRTSLLQELDQLLEVTLEARWGDHLENAGRLGAGVSVAGRGT